MFRYNSKANYQPNGGCYLQILSGKDLYKQTIVVSTEGAANTSDKGTFPARFQIFLLIIHWGKCMLGIEHEQTGIRLLCDYGKLS